MSDSYSTGAGVADVYSTDSSNVHYSTFSYSTSIGSGNYSLEVDNSTSTNRTDIQTINIGAIVPPEIGVPAYGYVAPVVIFITVLTNSFIVVVLSRPQLRSPTNCVLLAISVCESLTGLSSLPWFVYYYTLKGYVSERTYGLPPFWCRSFLYFSDVIPTIFHTAAIWLTVYLAIQRYVFVSQPTGTCATFARTYTAIAAILMFSVVLESPILLGRFTFPIVHDNKTACVFQSASWINEVYAAHYWVQTIFVYAGPCALLVAFNVLLICTLNKTIYRRQHSLGFVNGASALQATTKMLIVIIALFLITEIPAAVIFCLHVIHMTFYLLSQEAYRSMNFGLILRNVFILVSYPLKFAVYLSMSHQFRQTVKMLFCPNLVKQPPHKPSIGSKSRHKSSSVDMADAYDPKVSENLDLLSLQRESGQ